MKTYKQLVEGINETLSLLEEAEGLDEDLGSLKSEELKGNQHKIDANKNGKVDGHDFKILRNQKKARYQ